MVNKIVSYSALLCAAILSVFVFYQRAEIKEQKIEFEEINERVLLLEKRMRTGSGAGEVKQQGVKDFFAFAGGMDEQLQSIKKEIEEIKQNNPQDYDKSLEARQINVLKDVHKSFNKIWTQWLSTQLDDRNGLDDRDKSQIVRSYTKMLEGAEETQIKWIRGDVTLDESVLEIKRISQQYYDDLEHSVGKEKADVGFDTVFPNPEMRKYIFSK